MMSRLSQQSFSTKEVFTVAALIGHSFAQESMSTPVEHKVQRSNAAVAHGTVMGFAFAFLFPLGGIIIRVASHRRLVWIHAAVQAFAYALALAGMGLGVYIAVSPKYQYTSKIGHPIIGTLVVTALYIQPVLGLLHHHIMRTQERASTWTYLHVWWGRIIITLGIINGGLGLMLSGESTKGEIAYGVIAGVIWVVWVAVSVVAPFPRRKNKLDRAEKRNGPDGNGTVNDNHHA